MDNVVQLIQENEARLNVTYGGQNGDLPDAVSIETTDGDIKTMATEAVAGGGIPGIPTDARADFGDFVVERYPPTEDRTHHLIQLRPKTEFGG